MKFYPHTALEDLGFDKIKELIKSYCLSDDTKDKVENLPFYCDVNLLRAELERVAESVKSIQIKDALPMSNFSSVGGFLHRVAPANAALELEEIVVIYNILLIHKACFDYFQSKERRLEYSYLWKLIEGFKVSEDLLESFNSVLNEDGEVRDNASSRLVQIRKELSRNTIQIESIFNKIIKNYKELNYLIDSEESYRNGRRVLSVKAENKRKIRGIIHDESTTGKTAFIEPEEVINLNNDLFDLQMEERKEIYKIIVGLCDGIRLHVEDIKRSEDLLISLDILRAKALLAQVVGGTIPKEINEEPTFNWLNAFHPILKIKNKTENKITVPSDFVLHHDNKILLISGPNAGGKSIALKTMGLLQLMLQYGLLVPVSELSTAGIFKQVFVDIGDQQSLENDLSTYSSRLQKLAYMLDNADDTTLILIDEFGSGTDPKVGGAMAESALYALIKKKSFGVITTHYSNLKVFAFRQKGVVNAAMEYDKKAMTPTYKLNIGKPGSSFAFEIAEKMNLPQTVIQAAKKKMGAKAVAIEDVLVELQRERQVLQEKIASIESREAKADQLIKSYEKLKEELDYKRKRLKLSVKEKEIALESELNRHLENTIREIKEEKNIEQAKLLAQNLRQSKRAIGVEIQNLQEEVYNKEIKDLGPIEIGSFVRMKNGHVTGKVADITDKKARVIFGSLPMEVKLNDLVKWQEPIDIRPKKSVNTSMASVPTEFKTRIDIRGMNAEEALSVLEKYFDQGVTLDHKSVRILHGKGSGVLKKIVRQKAKEYSEIEKITHPDPEQGGDGISIVHFI